MSSEVFLHELWVAWRITCTVLCIIFAGYFWNRRRRTDFKDTRMIFLGQGLFMICFGLTRSLFAISDFFTTDPYYINKDLVLVAGGDLFISDLFWKISTLVGILGIIFLLLVIETYLVKSRYFFTVIATIGLIVAMVSPDINLSRWATYITLPIAMLGLIILYFYLLYKGSGIVRKKAGESILGLFLLGVGTILGTSAGMGTLRTIFGSFPEFIPVIILTVGLAIYTYINVKE